MVILEKKSNIIDPSKVVIPENYLLIKPDPNYTEFQYKGRETGILSSDFSYDQKGRRVAVKSRNYSVMGTVYSVPKRLRYDVRKADKLINGKKALAKKDGVDIIVDESLFSKVSEMKHKSLDYETQMEVNIGDRVRFSYMAHERVKERLGMIETTDGLMYFIRYDDLQMVVDSENNPIKCLNGYILVSPDTIEIENKDGVDGVEKNGIFVVKLGDKEKRSRKNMSGTVLCGSTPVTGYKNINVSSDPDIIVEKGDRLLFDPRGGLKLEMMNHQEYSEEDLILIRRIDIYLSSRDNPDFDKIDFKH